jgi:hypothetical protein
VLAAAAFPPLRHRCVEPRDAGDDVVVVERFTPDQLFGVAALSVDANASASSHECAVVPRHMVGPIEELISARDVRVGNEPSQGA